MRRNLQSVFGLDPRSLALFRIGLGLVLLVDLAIRLTDLEAHYTDAGAVPRSVVREYGADAWHWSPHLLGGSAWYQATLFTVAAAMAVCLAIGYRTRLATVLSWILLVSLQTRNPLVLNGGDVLLRMLLFWSMFLPLGCIWSVDQRRGEKRGQVQFAGTDRRMLRTNWTCPLFSPATVCLLLQICLVYWMSGFWKLQGGWREPDMLLRILQFDNYARAPAYALQMFPSLLTFMGQGILWTELVGPCLLFCPWWTKPIRCLVIVSFFLLHLGIELTLTVGLFSYVCWLAWIPLLPDTFWNAFAGLTRRPMPQPQPASLCTVRDGPSAPRTLAFLPVFCMIFIIVWNASRATGSDTLPNWARSLGRKLLIAQKWDLFSQPPRRDGWHVIVAHLGNGQAVDLLRDGADAEGASYQKPPFIYLRYQNHRWRKYYRRLVNKSRDCFREPLCQYLARKWNDSHAESEQAVRIVMQYMEERSGIGQRDTYRRRHLHESTSIVQGMDAFTASG